MYIYIFIHIHIYDPKNIYQYNGCNKGVKEGNIYIYIYIYIYTYTYMYIQCSKLRVHPAPCVHILAVRCMDFETCAPGVCMIFPTF